MLKYNDLISKLTDEQKIRILTNVGDLSGKDMKILGIPLVKAGNMKDCLRDVYPHTTSIAHAWDVGLWGSVASDKIEKMVAEQTNFAIAPGARIKLSPYRKEATEDPYLAAALSGSYIKAASSAGVNVGAAGYYVTESDVAWLDSEPNDRIINEYIVRPYKMAAEIGGSSLRVTDKRAPNEAYKDVCGYIQRAVVDDTEFFVCEKVSDDNTVDFVSRGIICLDASENALTVAVSRYKKLKQLFEQGKDVTAAQIEDEINDRRVISGDTLDMSLDKALEFIYKCASEPSVVKHTEEQTDALALRATLESTVLLKNEDNILPVARGRRIAIIGGVAFSDDEEGDLASECRDAFTRRGFKRIRAAKGYDAADYSYIDKEAITVCKRSDLTVLFLGSSYDTERRIAKTEKLTLPPNQLYFADRIAELGKRVVAVIMSEHAPDIEFTRNFDAVILAPHGVKHSAEALVRILTGEYNPSGHLAYTLYGGTERSLYKGSVYMHELGMKAGPFIGYRYYDTADMNVGYPFGHGLSYTDFAYSNMKLANGKLTFTVKNIGTVKGVAVPQIYVGISSSSVLRPKKELCGFARVELAPHERKRVTVSLELPKVYYNGEYVTEKGTYTVYVGASVSDIRLKRRYRFDGATLEKDGEKLSRYLQTYSNILEDNYTLEADYKSMKKTVKNILFGISTLALAISLTVFNVTTNARSLFLGVVAGILAVFSILFFIIEAVERGKAHAAERKRIAEANKAYFEEAEQVPVLSTDVMFKDEFDAVREEKSIDSEFHEADDDADYSEFIDDNFRIKDAVAEFNKFAADRGYRMGRGVAENLFASLTTSRLLIFNGLSSEEFNSFVGLLAEYFECTVSVDDALATAEGNSNVFFGYDSQWDHKSTNILTALVAATNASKRVQLAAIDGINADNIHAWLDPFMKYLRSPKRRNEILIFDEYGKNYGYNIGRNLWLAINLASDERIDDLPVACLKCASVVRISYTKCQEADDLTAPHGFTSYQADYMALKESGKYDVSEEIWKKIDRLEKYAKERSDYSIGNKLWLDLEKHLGMLFAAGMESADAVDAAVAVKLLPSLAATVKGKLSKEDKTVLQAAEFIFGEENVQYSKSFLDSLTVIRRDTTPEAEETDAVTENTETVDEAEPAKATETVENSEIAEISETADTVEVTEDIEVTEAAEDSDDVAENSGSDDTTEASETAESDDEDN